MRVRRHELLRDCTDADDEHPEHDDDSIDGRNRKLSGAATDSRQRDLELAGHSERISSLCVFQDSSHASVTLCSASTDWCGGVY